ncbi:MAG: hypothetical protein ACW9W4_08555 [Candidatus Nitrosopumilus sp. bin_7KS]
MKLSCLYCCKSFEGKSTVFCSQNCRYSHIAAIDRRVREAVKNDPSHMNYLSRN